MIHDRSYTRKMDWKHAVRKRRIDREVSAYVWPDFYNNLHQYSKNKIHCSCLMCRARGLYKGSNSKWGRSKTEQRQFDKINFEQMDWAFD